MATQEINLDALRSRIRGIRATMNRAAWSELLVDIVAALLVEESGYIIDATKPTDLMFGYIPGELAGKQLKILIPKRFWEIHDTHWQRYWQNPVSRAMGSRIEDGGNGHQRKLDIVGSMKDETEKNLTIALTPLVLAESRCAIALISERF